MATFLHKYRPQTLDDFHLDNQLHEIIDLFIRVDSLCALIVGDPSTGKTSLLNAILRRYYDVGLTNPLPMSNIMIVNTLKEQGIQYFRNEMKTFCQSRSTVKGRKKMLIIDDIDNISDQCQQVFRHYIDNYSNNINVLSSCCNTQKVIESIQSRLHILKLNAQTPKNVRMLMDRVIENEGIVIDPIARDYLLNITNSSPRQIINYLEKFHIIGRDIDLTACKALCSNIHFNVFESFVRDVKTKGAFCAHEHLNNLYSCGFSVVDILDYFYAFVKYTDILSEDEKYGIVPVICEYITVFHNIHENPIELSLFSVDVEKKLYNVGKIA